MLNIGDIPKDFSLPDQDGKNHSLKNYLGKWVVLYFYPKDDTPGCTKEACNFRDSFRQLQKLNVVVLGISKDSVKSHKKFLEKYNLNFPILSDEDHKIINEFGAWGKKKFMGREYDGIIRMTYLFDNKGKIFKIYPKVNPLTHAQEVLEDLSPQKN